MYRYIKRLIDLFFSILLILVLSPILVIVSVLILLLMKPPVFFKQKRIGLNNKPFQIYKFRSMLPKSEQRSSDAERMSGLGKIIRGSRIDELPQLYNIIKGDMSFIGPRPLLPEYLPYYSDQEIRRHDVRPGLSCLSQINKVDYPDWEVQLNMDVEYVNSISFYLDFKIFFGTLRKLLKPTDKGKLNSKPRPTFIEYRLKQAKEE